ncbi:hypothetical protein VP01_1289g1 [Puccinia sorghi]|uniref:Uncharacterized protein n=1 Tax=Puccinia sorghi TaxID=27349 RepID=A0A0L6VNK6_9BASI|nr:hypothetical protein VP01_1289g1 [Puccinia sorghi]
MEREQILIDPFKGPSALLFIKAFTLWSIYPQIIFLTAWATMLVLLDRSIPGLSLKLVSLSTFFLNTAMCPPTILTVLGTVIGFVLSYRTSSAYERYTEGRKQWSTIVHVSRTLACLIWSHCTYVLRTPTPTQPATNDEVTLFLSRARPLTSPAFLNKKKMLKGIIERKSFINLIEGFAVSLKHYLRGEHGIYYEDLYHLACFLPKYHFPTSLPMERPDLTRPEKRAEESHSSSQHNPLLCRSHTSIVVDKQVETQAPPTAPFPPPRILKPNYNPPEEKLWECIPVGIMKSIWKGTRNAAGLRKKKADYSRRIHEDNIPLEIICCMSAYIATLQHRGVLNVPLANNLLLLVSSLSDTLATLERILTVGYTPIPFGYIVHLRMIIWGYLIFLPFQLLSTFGYVTIPATALISISFLGFLKIGEEIENPFGYGKRLIHPAPIHSNDLDMDHFCQNLIARELAEITSMPPPDPEAFMFSSFNVPLYRQSDCRSAAELLRTHSSSAEIQNLLRTKASVIRSTVSKR